MPPAAATYAPRPRQARGRRLATTLLMGVLATGVISTPAATGAWFTADKTVSSNSLTAATLQPVSGLKAVKSSIGVDVSWTSALQQSWATANSVTSEPTYTVTRTIDGANPTAISTGTNLSVTDQYGKSVSIKPTVIDSGSSIAGYIRSDGTLMMWGSSSASGLANASRQSSSVPIAASIPAGNPIINMALNGWSGAAVSSTGKLFTWGPGLHGGKNCSDESSPPDTIQLPAGVTPIAASPGVGSYCSLLVLDSTGQLWQRGGSVGGTSTTFFKVNLPGGRTVKQLTRRETVLASDGTVWSWGNNSRGQFGNGTTTGSSTPVQAIFPEGTVITSVSADSQAPSFVAIASGGRDLYAWGYNDSYGALGLGSVKEENILTPTRMKTPENQWFSDAQIKSSTTVIVSGSDSSKLYSVGYASNGRAGNGVINNTATGNFIQMDVASNISATKLATGNSQAYFVDKSTNNLYGWGYAVDGSTGTALFGNNQTSPDVYAKPTQVQTNLQLSSDSARYFCGVGTTSNSDGYCVPNGVAEYSVTYPYQAWTSSSAKATASAQSPPP